MDVRNEILKILAFHDVFGFPLAGEEIFVQVESQKVRKSESQKQCSFQYIHQTLEQMVEEGVVEKEKVFYCLKGRKGIIRQRKIRYPISLRKLTKSRKWIRIFSLFPFIRVVNTAGTVADQNARRESDIDLVVETARGRVWTARFFLNAVLSVLRQRPRPGHTRDTFCTSFFYDEAFDPKSIMPKDPVFQNWIGGRIHASRVTRHASRVSKTLECLVGIIPEHVYRWIQIHLLMPRELRLANQKDGQMDVFFDSKVIKLHLNNRRKEFNGEFQKKLGELNV